MSGLTPADLDEGERLLAKSRYAGKQWITGRDAAGQDTVHAVQQGAVLFWWLFDHAPALIAAARERERMRAVVEAAREYVAAHNPTLAEDAGQLIFDAIKRLDGEG